MPRLSCAYLSVSYRLSCYTGWKYRCHVHYSWWTIRCTMFKCDRHVTSRAKYLLSMSNTVMVRLLTTDVPCRVPYKFGVVLFARGPHVPYSTLWTAAQWSLMSSAISDWLDYFLSVVIRSTQTQHCLKISPRDGPSWITTWRSRHWHIFRHLLES